MGMWDLLEEQYPAPGSPSGANGFPPLGASDASALLKLIERGVAARGQTTDDDASASQSARDTAAAVLARAVKPPYGRNEGWLTQAPEDWVQSILRGPYSGYPAWSSPANPASPFPPPPSPAVPVDAPIADENAGQVQGEREAAVRTVANAARHPYGRVFESVVPNTTPAETDDPRQAELAREAWARRLASQGRRLPPPPRPTETPIDTERMRLSQEAYEAGARRIAGAAHPPHGRREGPLTTKPEYAAERIGKKFLTFDGLIDTATAIALGRIMGKIFPKKP